MRGKSGAHRLIRGKSYDAGNYLWLSRFHRIFAVIVADLDRESTIRAERRMLFVILRDDTGGSGKAGERKGRRFSAGDLLRKTRTG